MIKLREYQEQALTAELQHRRDNPDETRLAIVLPTGTGKGTILAERAARFLRKGFDTPRNPLRDGRVLVLVHTDELVNDLAARCRLAASEPRSVSSPDTWTVGIVKAGQNDVTADIVVASVQTLARPERRAQIMNVGLVIVDECHHASAPTYVEVLEHFGCMPDCDCSNRTFDEPGCWDCRNTGFTHPPIPALGFTATLERGDGAGLGQVWQNVAFTRDISWAVRKGFLVQPIGYRLEIEPGGLGELGGAEHFTPGNPTALDMQIADGIAPGRIVEKWRELATGLCGECIEFVKFGNPQTWCSYGPCGTNDGSLVRQTIVFAPLVRSARKISTEFERARVSSAVIHGHMPPEGRRAAIAQFKAGQISVLVNAMVLTEGFDHPGVGCVIVARPTKSRSLFIQMAGRGLRPVPGIPVEDQDCVLITLADTTADLCSIADLSDRLPDRTADGPLTVMEDQWDIGKHLDEQSRHWTGRVDATQFDPIVTRSSKVWAKTKDGHWFLPISKEREYVFLLGTSVYLLTRVSARARRSERLYADLPDVELAMAVAEDEATERGGDLGALLADRTRPWRGQRPAEDSAMLSYARRLGLAGEVDRIMSSKAGGKAGKVSDLIRRVEASRSIDRAVERINARP